MAHIDTPSSAQIASIVKQAIDHAGLSQREVAEKSAVPLSTLNRRLTGGSPFVYEELAAVARVLGVKLSDLIAQAEAETAAMRAA